MVKLLYKVLLLGDLLKLAQPDMLMFVKELQHMKTLLNLHFLGFSLLFLVNFLNITLLFFFWFTIHIILSFLHFYTRTLILFIKLSIF